MTEPIELQLQALELEDSSIKVCPRCSYQRKAHETLVSARHCPRCQAPYEKTEPLAGVHLRRAERLGVKLGSPHLPSKQKDTSLLPIQQVQIPFLYRLIGLIVLIATLAFAFSQHKSRQRLEGQQIVQRQQAIANEKVNFNSWLPSHHDFELFSKSYGVHWLKDVMQAAQEGNPRAMVLLGILHAYRYPIMPQADPQIGLDWLDRAAKQGYALAWIHLGYIHENDLQNSSNRTHSNSRSPEQMQFSHERAVNYYRLAAAAGIRQGAMRLAKLYRDGFPSQSPRPDLALRFFELTQLLTSLVSHTS